MFYRYRNVGGVDYVSDFLLGGVDDQPLRTMPGGFRNTLVFKTPANPESNGKAPPKKRKPQAGESASASGFVYRPFAMLSELRAPATKKLRSLWIF